MEPHIQTKKNHYGILDFLKKNNLKSNLITKLTPWRDYEGILCLIFLFSEVRGSSYLGIP